MLYLSILGHLCLEVPAVFPQLLAKGGETFSVVLADRLSPFPILPALNLTRKEKHFKDAMKSY
jgi:hypothetical protein